MGFLNFDRSQMGFARLGIFVAGVRYLANWEILEDFSFNFASSSTFK